MTDHDFDRTARTWLEDGPTVMPDRALQAALDEVHLTRQRPALVSAWRIPNMSTTIRLALGAAAVLIAAVIGISVLPGTSGVGGGTAGTATPARTATPTPIPLPLYPQSLAVSEPGIYVAGPPFQIPVTVTVPAGWVGNVGGPYAAYLDKGPSAGTTDGAEVAFTLSQRLFADPCHPRGFLDPQPGPTVDDLASALAGLPGFEATTPIAVTVDGYRGKQLTLTAPGSFEGCTSTAIGYGLWQLPLGAVFSFLPGDRMTVWILDVDGQRLVLSSAMHPATSAQDRAEVQSILDSIRIGSAN